MTESAYTSSINKKLREQGVYVWKIYDPLNGGVPDAWYSGPAGDLWVEYKFVKAFPKTTTVRPKLQAKQAHWLETQNKLNRKTAVIVGSPEGAIIYEGNSWKTPVKSTTTNIRSKSEVCQWIIQQTLNSSNPQTSY